MNELTGSVAEYITRQLGVDDRYMHVLSSTQDEEARRQIDQTVRTFSLEMARVFDGFIDKLVADPETLAKFRSRYGK